MEAQKQQDVSKHPHQQQQQQQSQQENEVVVPELESLKREFLNRFAENEVEEDVVKKIKRVLKQFKELVYRGDSLQKIRSATAVSSSTPLSLATPSVATSASSTSSISNASSASKQQQSKAYVGITGAIHELNADQNNQLRFLLVAACEEISKLIKGLHQPYIIAKSCLANFESEGNSVEKLHEMLNQEFKLIQKKICHVLNNYSESLPVDVVDSLQELVAYYETCLKKYLSMNSTELKRAKNQRFSQIQAPFLGYYLVEESSVAYLYEKAQITIDKLRIQRVGTEFVHLFQKYLVTYVMNKVLLDSDIFAGLVVCLKDNKKKKTFFFIQYSDLESMEDIDQASQSDSNIIVPLTKHSTSSANEEQKIKQVNMNGFLKQVCASFLSMSFESFIPNYSICSKTGNIYRHQLNTMNEDRTSHAGIKNPLYFFKESFMIEKKSKEELEESLDFKRCNIENLLKAVRVLDKFARSDFKFELKKGRKHSSLFLSKEHILGLQYIVQEFQRTQTWLEEAVFSVRSRVCLLQIINQIQPLIIEFSMRIMSKTIQEHMGFMKKISIEDFLLKIASKKNLKKYVLLNKMFEDSRFAKDDTSSSQQSSSAQGGASSDLNKQSNPSAAGNASTNQQSNLNNNNNIAGNAISTPLSPPLASQISSKNQQHATMPLNAQLGSSSAQNFQIAGSQGYNANTNSDNGTSSIQIMAYLMELNLQNFSVHERKSIIRTASENLLFFPMILSVEQAQQLLNRFNRSWSNFQVWSETITQAPSAHIEECESFFVELLGLVFNVNIMGILTSETFKNLKNFDESNPHNFFLLRNYLKFSQVKGDKRFKQNVSLLEKSIQLKKYKLASLLLDHGEGINVSKEVIFDSLNESDYENERGKRLHEEFDAKMQTLIVKHHSSWLNEYYWEKMWRKQFHPANADHTSIVVYTQEYGKRCLPRAVWMQIFNFRREEDLDDEEELENEAGTQRADNRSRKSIEVHNNNNNNVIVGSLLQINNQLNSVSNIPPISPRKSLEIDEKIEGNNAKSNQLSPQKDSLSTPIKDSTKVKSQSPSSSKSNKSSDVNEKQTIEEAQIDGNEEKYIAEGTNEGNEQQQQEQDQQVEVNPLSPPKRIAESDSEIISENQHHHITAQTEDESQQQEQVEKTPNDHENGSVKSASPLREQQQQQQVEETEAKEEPNQKDFDHKIEEIPCERSPHNKVPEEQQQEEQEQLEFEQENELQEQVKLYEQASDSEDEMKMNKTIRLDPIIPERNEYFEFEDLGKVPVYLQFKNLTLNSDEHSNYFIENEVNRIDRACQQGRHVSQKKLSVFRGENMDILVEETPNYPGLTFAMDAFIRMFTADPVRAKSILVRINNTDYLFTQVLHGCTSLANTLKASQNIPKLEKHSIGERFILDMILGSQFNGFSQEILSAMPNNSNSHSNQSKEFRLMNISNSTSLVVPIVKDNSVNYVINMRNVLFCLDQMHDTIDQQVFMKFRSINPEKILDEWLTGLIAVKESIATTQKTILENANYKILHPKQKSSKMEAKSAILFSKPMIKRLYERLFRLNKFLKKAHSEDAFHHHNNSANLSSSSSSQSGSSVSQQIPLPKYQDIFEAVNPLIASMYRRVNSLKTIPVQARFELIESNLDKLKSFVISDIPSFVSNFSSEKIPVDESLDEVIANFNSIGPVSAKLLVKQLAKTSRKDGSHWEDVFSNVTKDSQVKLILSTGYLEQDWNEAGSVERVMSSLIHFQQKPVQELKHLLHNLIFDYMENVTWKQIRTVASERITSLSLRGCSKITDPDVVKIAESLPLLTFLDLSRNPSLLKFNQTITSKYAQSKPLHFPYLKTLILEECVNLSICDVEGVHIQSINLSSCLSLVHILTATPNLKRISLNSCIALLEEHVCLYIIDGTQCMIDELTSQGIFKQILNSMELHNNTKINIYKMSVQGIFGRLFVKIKSIVDLQPLIFALNRRGLNKGTLNKESSGFFGFSKKPSASISESNIRTCRMNIIQLLFKNSNIHELKFMHICEDLRDMNISSLLKALAEKLQELSANQDQGKDKQEIVKIDTIDISDIKLTEQNMKSLGEIVSSINTNSSTGLSIYLQATQESQNSGFKYFCAGLRNEVNKIDLSKNRLGKDQLVEICKMIVDLGNGQKNRLNQLYLKNCRINNELLGQISQAVKLNSTLRLLDLSDNFFDHEGLQTFVPTIYDNTTLSSLILDGNTLRGDGFQSIRKARFLKRLDLEQCGLEEKEITHICWLISEYQCLNFLDLSFNKLNVRATINLVQSLSKANCIKELAIRRVFPEEESTQNASRIADIIADSPTLQTLEMSSNSISSEGLIQIGKALAKNSTLRVLKINDDHSFALRGVINLAHLIQANDSLQVINSFTLLLYYANNKTQSNE